MDGALENIVIDALDRLESGEGVDQILWRHPAEAAELRPILETADQLAELPPEPSAEAQVASRQALLQHAQQMRDAAARSRDWPSWPRFIFSFVSVLVVILIGGAALLPASENALPGDALYPLKRGGERVRLLLAPQSEKGQLRLKFEKERNSEVYEMLETGRNGQAGYTGEIVSIAPRTWEIGHITVHITEETTIEGEPEVGARVEAHCLVEDGQVYAESLEILPSGSDTAPSP